MHKLTYFVLSFVLLSANVFAEKLTVFVRDGLVIRDQPNLQGKKVGLIPFGAQIDIEESDAAKPLKVSGITAKFAKVTHQGKSGFVFKGFLSKFPPPTKKAETVEDYLRSSFGPGKSEKLKHNEEHSETKKEQYVLKNGIRIVTTTYLGGAYSQIEIPDAFEIREVYLLFTAIERVFKDVPFDESNQNIFKCDVFLNDPIDKTGPVMSFEIKKQNGFLKIVSGGQT